MLNPKRGHPTNCPFVPSRERIRLFLSKGSIGSFLWCSKFPEIVWMNVVLRNFRQRFPSPTMERKERPMRRGCTDYQTLSQRGPPARPARRSCRIQNPDIPRALRTWRHVTCHGWGEGTPPWSFECFIPICKFQIQIDRHPNLDAPEAQSFSRSQGIAVQATFLSGPQKKSWFIPKQQCGQPWLSLLTFPGHPLD